MVNMVSTVECAVCMKTHLETPPEREGVDLDGKRVIGVWPKDFTYYRDWYEGAYNVVCKKEHDAVLAPKLAKLES